MWHSVAHLALLYYYSYLLDGFTAAWGKRHPPFPSPAPLVFPGLARLQPMLLSNKLATLNSFSHSPKNIGHLWPIKSVMVGQIGIKITKSFWNGIFRYFECFSLISEKLSGFFAIIKKRPIVGFVNHNFQLLPLARFEKLVCLSVAINISVVVNLLLFFAKWYCYVCFNESELKKKKESWDSGVSHA